MMRTRVKFCGFTREADVQAAVTLGVDALGFVFYDKSPRYVSPEVVGQLIQKVPAFISTVGLFVNASIESIQRTLSIVPITALQLHGDESWHFAIEARAALQKPVIKAVRDNDATDWDEVVRYADHVAGVLLDADAVGYGGAGHVFDWKVIPAALRPKIILSGGLRVENIAEAIGSVQPYALDVSSGIEDGVKGIKHFDKMQAFMRTVTHADQLQAL